MFTRSHGRSAHADRGAGDRILRCERQSHSVGPFRAGRSRASYLQTPTLMPPSAPTSDETTSWNSVSTGPKIEHDLGALALLPSLDDLGADGADRLRDRYGILSHRSLPSLRLRDSLDLHASSRPGVTAFPRTQLAGMMRGLM